MSSPPPEAQQLLVLAGDEVDGGVLQQGREDEEQTNSHPDVDGFDVGHLEGAEPSSVSPRLHRWATATVGPSFRAPTDVGLARAQGGGHLSGSGLAPPLSDQESLTCLSAASPVQN